MKKLSVLLTVVMMSMMVAACGQKGEEAAPETTPAAVETVENAAGAESAPAEESAPAKEEDAAEENAADEAAEDAAEENAADAEEEAPAEEAAPETKEEVEQVDDNAEEEQASAGGYEDNFAVDTEAAVAFADKIKTAVAEKNIEALADLTAYPVYVGFKEGGASVTSKEELIAFGADLIFTPEMCESIDGADTSSLSPSMAGFALSKDGRPNMIFGVRDGKLAISGINY